MSVILTGNLAMLLLRFGAYEPLEPTVRSAADVLGQAGATNEAVTRIGNSLQSGAANHWLRERDIDLMAHYRGSADAVCVTSIADGRQSQPSLFSLPPAPPLEFVLGPKGNPRKRDRVTLRRCSLGLPDGFLLPVREELDFGPDTYIVHPAVSFAIAATKLGPAEIVEYGMGLCGSYALLDQDTWQCVPDVPPLTRVDRLAANVRLLARRWRQRPNSPKSGYPRGLTKCLESFEPEFAAYHQIRFI